MRDAEVQIHHHVAIGDVRSRRELIRRLDISARPREPIGVTAAVIDNGPRGYTGRRYAAADRRQLHERRTEIRIACGVLLVDVPERLIVSADARIVRKQPVGRSAADFDGRLVIEHRGAHAQRSFAKAGIRAGFDHLIDVSGQALAFGVCRGRAGIDLQFRHAQRRQLSRGIVVERTVYRNAVEFVADLIVVAAANVDGLEIAGLIERHYCARNRCNGRIGAVQTAAAAQRANPVLR